MTEPMTPMTLRARLPHPIADVRRALTDPAALREWLAEHAEVDLPHRYEFWGRYTPDGDAPRQRVLHADDTTLRLGWTIDGVETTTEFTLAEDGTQATVLTLAQSHFDFNDVITGASVRGALQTFWALTLSNLADHLAGRPLTPRTDFTGAKEFRGEVLIDAPVADVYRSMTDSAEVSKWFGFPVGIEPVKGGRFAMGGLDNNPSPALILDVVPGSAMTIDFGPGGVSSWELAESGGRTRLTFVQSGFDETNPPYAAWTGWLAGVAELRRYHETTPWQPIWLP